ncbi:MAG: adenylate/guanylate cyclase domain-containing protein [Elainellaceae cyanobacterium]
MKSARLKRFKELRIPVGKRLTLLTSALNRAFRVSHAMTAHFRASFKALKQSEARTRALLDAIPDLILEIDRRGIYVDYIEAKGQWLLSQTAPAERIGKSIWDILPHDVAELYFLTMQHVLTGKDPQTLEYELWVNQNKQYYEARVVAYSEQSALFIVRNISQQRFAENELRHSESTNRTLVSAIPDLLIRMKGDGTYLGTVTGNVSNSLLNAAQQSQSGMNIREILPPDLAEQRLYYITLALTSGQTQIYEQRLEMNGTIQYEEVRIVVMGDDEVLNIIRDVTARKQAEESLRLANEELEQRVALRTAELQQEKERSEHLLLNILPGPIAEQLKHTGTSPAEHFEEVTILFADIVGFTGLAARIDPLALVGQLNQLFSTFDYLVDTYGVEKIKTIGDAYMVVGGLPIPCQEHVQAIANLALDMQKHMESQLDDLGHPMRLRIGINTGPVIAGVIGVKRFIYDLWGDAVNVASRMESHSKPGSIQVTEATYHRLKEHYYFEKRGTIPIRGRGNMTTYWLLGKKDDQNQISCQSDRP